jgi:branched-subunit amino acid aminotransferase/4-amino-4-deoxychorismate lyase
MRTYVIENAQSAGLRIVEKQFTFDQLAEAHEVFLTNSQFGVLPVNRCGDLHWKVGDLSRKIMGMMAELGIAECKH